MTQLVIVPVLLPLLGAGLCLVLGRSARAQRLVSVVVLSTVVVTAATLLVRADRFGPQAVSIGGWGPDIGISLVADRLSALMLLVSTVVTLCVLLYSFGQGIVEFGRDTPLSVFHPTYLVLSAGVSNAFLSADLFNLFVGFEVLLASSFVLITLGGTEARIRAGTIYIIVSLVSSMIFLISIACVYAATGTVNFAQLATRLGDLPPGVALMLQLLLLTTFCIKAAVFPLSAWLPDSYPTAPAPVTAVFAGLLTKVGIYAIVRTQTLLFPGDAVRDLLLWASILTMVIGILGAVAQSDVKRVLSFTLVSHIGFMLFGIAIASQLGLSGAIFYIVHHITVQTVLFLVAGLIEYRSGTTNLEKLGGLARSAPVLAVVFFVPAMNLAGIPPFSGFLGKIALGQAGIAAGDWLAIVGVAASVLTSLLTLYAVAKVWNRAFWQPVKEVPADHDDDWSHGPLHGHGQVSTGTQVTSMWEKVEEETRVPFGMGGPTVILVLASIVLTVAAGPLFGITDRAAAELLERTPYIVAVLGEAA
ncbi:Na+/H+ antiporter subunit D [Aeromicrobium sp. CF4.19]|uniref:Na+/H+ antiporter subunit D n=1 Tax=Aeromicrobium sp. CF4.19 TaxID=3373082 RepID=UPI003EE70AEC